MVDITAKVICDSIGEHSPRLTTMLLRHPKFIHAEFTRHRSFSLCVSSSRAVPVSKNLEEVCDDALRAGPVYWGAEQKGMQSGEELTNDGEKRGFVVPGDYVMLGPLDSAKTYWQEAAYDAARNAERLITLGVHKSIVNRLLEPFLHVNVLVTSCEPGLLNFFGLRLDKAAQPEMRALAEAMWAAWCESTPKLRVPGHTDGWHLPFADDGETNSEIMLQHRYLGRDNAEEFDEEGILQARIKVSVARCARLSYTSFETGRRSTVEEDLNLYDRLITSHPIHASPAEHQATPDVCLEPRAVRFKWAQPELHGNLPGWRQYRKQLPGEAVAELPEAYR